MQTKVELLSDELVHQILDEAFQLMLEPGIKVQSPEARELLAAAGAKIDNDSEVARIPETLVRSTLESAPKEFFLYDRFGQKTVQYGGDAVHFDPGSSGVNILDPETLEHKAAQTNDLVRLIKVTEMLPQYDAQSTAIVCNEIPKAIGDLYRLYLVLMHSDKPIVTGAFSAQTLQTMIDMLVMVAGNQNNLAEKPQAVFDVCPNPPLVWSDFGANNLINLARAQVPAQMVSMPLAGAVAPVTLLGSVVQHAAECLSGIAIHQLAHPGAPIVWGGAPAIFDMRKGTTPMGAIETAMIDASYAQVGKSLRLPTHTYLGASDSKLVDYQAGLESGVTALVGALAGINMISGAGMLDFLVCQSPEKLVADAESMYEGINFKGEFLKQRTTRELFSKEQHIPSAVIDRDSIRGWHEAGSLDTFERAKSRAQILLDKYQPPENHQDVRKELTKMVTKLANEAGLDALPA